MNRAFSTFLSLLILAKCLVIDGCVEENVRCEKTDLFLYRSHRIYEHILSGEECLNMCTRVRSSRINYFTYDTGIHKCRCTENCLIDREESAKGDVAGLVSNQDPSELCVTEADVEEEADALISIVMGGSVILNPLSEDSYCNSKENRDASTFPMGQFNLMGLPAIFFNNNEIVYCGLGSCRSFGTKRGQRGFTTYGLKERASNTTSVTFSNGTTWLLGGVDAYSGEAVTTTSLYHPDHTVTVSPIPMPQPMRSFCGARISDSQVLLVNGLTGDTFMIDTEQGSEWISLPSLPSPLKEKVYCALAKNSGDPLVIVDAWKGKNGKYEPSQIFHVASKTWSYAPGKTKYDIPYLSSILPLGNSVISVGGFVIDETGQEVKNSWIRTYDLKTGDWVVRGPELVNPLGDEFHMLASKSLEMCKPKE